MGARRGGGPEGRLKPPGLHTTTRELQTCTFEGSGASKTPRKFHEKTAREGQKKNEMVAGEGGKKSEILGGGGGSSGGGSGGRWSREVKTSNNQNNHNHNNAKPRTSGAPKGRPLPSKV